jgi:hypothetical protein
MQTLVLLQQGRGGHELDVSSLISMQRLGPYDVVAKIYNFFNYSHGEFIKLTAEIIRLSCATYSMRKFS